MKRNRLILLAVLGVISLACFIYMNMHYDILARNTSVTSANRTLILEKLDSDQIRYIVENNIDVNIFYKYLEDDMFVFDNYRNYDKAMRVRQGSVHTIVTFVNAVSNTIDFDNILVALQYYDYATLRKMLVDHSPYNNHAEIILNPDDVSVSLNINTTIGEYEPSDLIALEHYPNIVSMDPYIQLRKECADALNDMCVYLESSLGTPCGGIVVSEGYLSYDTIQQNYLNAISQYGAQMAFEMWGWPSHNEHQLGLCVDVDTASGELLEYSVEYSYLKEIAHRYGFAFYTEADFNHLKTPQHMRYIGRN